MDGVPRGERGRERSIPDVTRLGVSPNWESKELQQSMELDHGDGDGRLTAGPARAAARAVGRGLGRGFKDSTLT
ncbi:unnamed protein product, partial [Brenthis ino]